MLHNNLVHTRIYLCKYINTYTDTNALTNKSFTKSFAVDVNNLK